MSKQDRKTTQTKIHPHAERLLIINQQSTPSKGRAIDNVMIERLWRTVKYEEVYLKEYVTGADLYQGLKSYFAFYSHERKHQSLDRQTPADVYRSGRSTRLALSI